MTQWDQNDVPMNFGLTVLHAIQTTIFLALDFRFGRPISLSGKEEKGSNETTVNQSIGWRKIA